MSDRSRAPVFSMAVLAMLGLVPYVRVLWLWPVSSDATAWIANGASSSAGWLEWVFATRHFNVGYRPLTALSYTINHAIGGFAAWPYRLTDLLLHVLCGILVYVLYRRSAPTLPRWGGLLASAIFLFHPLAEQVVPHLARRSYSLATMFGLAGLLALMSRREPRRPGSWRIAGPPVIGALALFCAVLANEAAYLYVAIAPVLWLAVTDRRSGRLAGVASACGPTFVLAAVALLLRFMVVDGLGGYAAATLRGERVVPIALATFKSLAWLNPPRLDATMPRVLQGIGAVVALYYVWRGIDAIRAAGRPEARIVGALLLWVIGFGLLFAPMAVWFPRQVYVALAPFALVVGVVLALTVQRYAGLRFVLHALPQLLLLGWLATQSPVPTGGDAMRAAAWTRTDRMLRDLHEQVRTAPEPSRLRLALPSYRQPEPFAFRARERRVVPLSARQPERWMRALAADRDVQIQSLLLFREHPLEAATPPVFRPTDDGAGIVLSDNRSYVLLDPSVRARSVPGGFEIRPDPTPPDNRPTLLYFHDGRRGVTLPWDRR